MADKKITALTAATSAASEDLIHVIDDPSGSPVNKKLTVKNFVGGIAHTTTGSAADTLLAAVLTCGDGQTNTNTLTAVSGRAVANDATSATAVKDIYGGYFESSLQSTNNTVTGRNSAIRAVCDISDGVATLGTTNVMSLSFKEAGTARGAAPNSYIEIMEEATSGANPATYLMDIFPTDGNGNLTFQTGADLGFYDDGGDKATAGAKDGTLKIRVNGEAKYIQLWN